MARYQVQENESLWAIARRAGIPLEQLLKLNPGLARGQGLKPGTKIRLGAGVQMPEKNVPARNPNNPNRHPNPGMGGSGGDPDAIENMLTPYGGIGASSAIGNQVGNRPGGQGGVEWQDPQFLAFMRQFGYNKGLLAEKRRHEVARLRNQFRQNASMYQDQRQQHRRDTDNDFSGRGMFFSGGRERETQLGLDRINMVRERERSTMVDNINDVRFNTQNEINDWRQRRAEERLAARERQTQLDLDIATGRA